MTPAPGPGDRRRRDRRSEDVPLADYTVPRLRKTVVTAGLLLAILALLLYMLRDMVVALVAGVVVGAYLVPFHTWLRRRLKSSRVAALVSITLFTVPLVAALVYSWIEITDTAEYLQRHRQEVAGRLTAALHRIPFTGQVDVEDDLTRGVAAAAERITAVVEGLQETLDVIVISIAVFLFTVFYILTDHRRILAYLHRKTPGRYRELAAEIGGNVEAVVYGALYATFLTQLVKSINVLALNLIFDVPLAIVLAIAAFFIGFFPIVGSWLVYVPVAIYVMVFQDNLAGGVLMLLVGFVVNTLFLSMYLRPKIAAERSHVLNFYWMFIALLTGVYTFGLVGIIIGPVLIAVLKAVFDTVTEGGAASAVGAEEVGGGAGGD